MHAGAPQPPPPRRPENPATAPLRLGAEDGSSLLQLAPDLWHAAPRRADPGGGAWHLWLALARPPRWLASRGGEELTALLAPARLRRLRLASLTVGGATWPGPADLPVVWLPDEEPAAAAAPPAPATRWHPAAATAAALLPALTPTSRRTLQVSRATHRPPACGARRACLQEVAAAAAPGGRVHVALRAADAVLQRHVVVGPWTARQEPLLAAVAAPAVAALLERDAATTWAELLAAWLALAELVAGDLAAAAAGRWDALAAPGTVAAALTNWWAQQAALRPVLLEAAAATAPFPELLAAAAGAAAALLGVAAEVRPLPLVLQPGAPSPRLPRGAPRILAGAVAAATAAAAAARRPIALATLGDAPPQLEEWAVVLAAAVPAAAGGSRHGRRGGLWAAAYAVADAMETGTQRRAADAHTPGAARAALAAQLRVMLPPAAVLDGDGEVEGTPSPTVGPPAGSPAGGATTMLLLLPAEPSMEVGRAAKHDAGRSRAGAWGAPNRRPRLRFSAHAHGVV